MEHDKPENLLSDDGHIGDMEFDFAEGVADSLGPSGLKSRRRAAVKVSYAVPMALDGVASRAEINPSTSF